MQKIRTFLDILDPHDSPVTMATTREHKISENSHNSSTIWPSSWYQNDQKGHVYIRSTSQKIAI